MDGPRAANRRVPKWRQRLAFALAAALLAITALTGGSVSSAGNVHGAVYSWAAANEGRDVPVLVQTDGDSDTVADFIRSSGGTVQREFEIIPAVEADVSPALVSALASHPDVAWVSLDAPVLSTGTTIDTSKLATAYPFSVNADKVWNADTPRSGAGVTVAVVDTGITSSSSDFKNGGTSRVVFNVEVNPNTTRVTDGYGHGTHIAGIVGGDGDAMTGKYIGIAPGANLGNVKISDDNGNATLSDLIFGLQWVYENKAAYNIRVVNLSLQSGVAQSYKTDPLDAAVEFLWFNGIAVVASAGNLGSAPDAVSYAPGNDPFVVVVGAVDDAGTATQSDDYVPDWSSRGYTQDGFYKPDIVAPGRRIVSNIDTRSYLATTYPANLVDRYYFRMSGTSMAAGVVSGVVALMLEQNPGWSPGQVKYVLQNTASNVPGDGVTREADAYRATFYTASVGNTDDGLTPSYLASSSVVKVGAVAYVLGSADPVAEGQLVGLDLEAAGIAGASLDTVDWGAIKWDAIKWSAIKWDAIKWDAIKWDAIKWGAITWDAIKWSSDINFDAIKWSAIKWSAIKWSAIKWSAIKWSGSGLDFNAIKWSAIKWDTFRD